MKYARKGNPHAYRRLVEPYFNLVIEYLYLGSHERETVLDQAEAVFRETWKRLPYLKRLSDWERVLATTLSRAGAAACGTTGFTRSGRLAALAPEAKFAIVAFDLEDWSRHWLGLALRRNRDEVGRLLFESRCRLLELNPGDAKPPTARLLRQVSDDIDGEIAPRKRRPLQQRLSRNPAARDFKCRWLDVRCELIEMRQEIRMPQEERDRFLARLQDLSRNDMLRPPLRSRVRNLVSFCDAPIPRIAPGRRRQVQSAG